MEREDRVERLAGVVSGWPGITAAPHRFGGTGFRFGRGEIGHVHPDGLVDVPFPRPVRDRIVAAGKARPHHVLPNSGWVSLPVRSEADLAAAIELLRLSYDLRREHAAERGGSAQRPGSP